jgi:hypothetical protein
MKQSAMSANYGRGPFAENNGITTLVKLVYIHQEFEYTPENGKSRQNTRNLLRSLSNGLFSKSILVACRCSVM